jgi:lipoate-protein ligase B
MNGQLEIIDLGTMDYAEAWFLQKRMVDERAQGKIPDTLLLVEHPPVITLGASAKADALLLPLPVFKVERGGDATYHGPGQLVGYPIIDLAERGLKVRAYLRMLESVLIEAVAPLGVAAQRLEGFTGVWAGGKKIASIGVAVKRGVSYHGFALNIDCDLEHFKLIYPCRLEPEQLSSLSQRLGRPVDSGEVRRLVRHAFVEQVSRFQPASETEGTLPV